jgi:hypothetical protein
MNLVQRAYKIGFLLNHEREDLVGDYFSVEYWGGGLSSGAKIPGREANHSLPSSTEVKNTWSHTSTSPRVFMAWYVVKHRKKFILPSTFFQLKLLQS